MVAVACLGAELASGDMAQGNLSVKAWGGGSGGRVLGVLSLPSGRCFFVEFGRLSC